MKRSAGVLMPISSLPSKYGIGTLGKGARDFIDFLEKSGQTYWQVLPIGPTGYGDSPYQSFSSNAGNPYFIDLDDLCDEGYLEKEEYVNENYGTDVNCVDYAQIYNTRFTVLRKAVERLSAVQTEDYLSFLRDNAGLMTMPCLWLKKMIIKDRLIQHGKKTSANMTQKHWRMKKSVCRRMLNSI